MRQICEGKIQTIVNFSAFLVMDVFRGQMIKAVRSLPKDHNIFIAFVLNNITNIFLPLELMVNSSTKKFMKEKYTVWDASKIPAGLEEDFTVNEIYGKAPQL